MAMVRVARQSVRQSNSPHQFLDQIRETNALTKLELRAESLRSTLQRLGCEVQGQ